MDETRDGEVGFENEILEHRTGVAEPEVKLPRPGGDYCLAESGGGVEGEARRQAVAEVIGRIPEGDFDRVRSTELNRIALYLDTFAELYGVDMRAVSISRTQMLSTVMKSYILWVENMFDEGVMGEKTQVDEVGDKTFFDSRLVAQGFQFNANGFARLFGHRMGFSVLKRPMEDEWGEFEVDYPAITIDEEIVESLRKWHGEAGFGGSLGENPVFKLGQEIVSNRIHDWLHAAVLYDTQSLTEKFDQWSKDGYFVDHLFKDAGRINYELLTNHIHHQVWQRIFEKNPGVKTEMIGKIKDYLGHLGEFDDWDKQNNGGDGSKGKFMAFVGLRGVFDVIGYDDVELVRAIGDTEYYQATMEFVEASDEMKEYLDTMYDENLKIPFGENNQRELRVDEIVNEYVDALREELGAIRTRSILTAFYEDEGAIVPLAREVYHLPKQIRDNLDKYRIGETDPRIFRLINTVVADAERYGVGEVMRKLCERVEVDGDGYMYLKVEQDELPVEELGVEVTHQKAALFFTWPESRGASELDLVRVKTLMSGQQGGRVEVNPGDLVLVNIGDPKLGEEIVDAVRNDEGDVDSDKLFNEILKRADAGKSVLLDMYPYDREKANQVFGVPQEGEVVGVYRSGKNKRKAFRSPGPISVNVEGRGQRRRVLEGVVVQNHVITNGELDIFPVDRDAFEVFYEEDVQQLPDMILGSEFFNKVVGNLGVEKSTQREVFEVLLQALAKVNYIHMYGYRGKPGAKSLADVME